MTLINWEEVVKRNYIVLHNKVYNVENFIHAHPGGAAVLKQWMGRDATEVFENLYHSEHAREMLKDLYVGDLNTESTFVKPSINPLFYLAIFGLIVCFGFYLMFL